MLNTAFFDSDSNAFVSYSAYFYFKGAKMYKCIRYVWFIEIPYYQVLAIF